VLAAEAFLTHNAHVSAAEETERCLDEDHRYLEDIGEIQDVVTVLQYLATQMQRGKNIRRFVNDTFLRFFSGVTSELEWEDTAGQILGD
jgi:hypothetical protein